MRRVDTTRECLRLARHWLGILSSAGACLLLSFRMFQLWAAPQSLDPSWLPFGGGLYLLEFFAIHATGVVAGGMDTKRLERSRPLVLLAAVAGYLGVGWALCWLMNSQSLFLYFAVLVFGRAVHGYTASREQLDESMAVLWVTAVLYIGLSVPTFSAAWPRLGLTPEVVSGSRYALEVELHGMVGVLSAGGPG